MIDWLIRKDYIKVSNDWLIRKESILKVELVDWLGNLLTGPIYNKNWIWLIRKESIIKAEWMNEWMNEWMIDWLIDWLTAWLIRKESVKWPYL